MQLKAPAILICLATCALASCATESEPGEKEGIATDSAALLLLAKNKRHLSGTCPSGAVNLGLPQLDGSDPPMDTYYILVGRPDLLHFTWRATLPAFWGARVRAPGTTNADITAYVNQAPFIGDMVGYSANHGTAFSNVIDHSYVYDETGVFAGTIAGYGEGTADVHLHSEGFTGPDFRLAESYGTMTIVGASRDLQGMRCSGTWVANANFDQSAQATWEMDCEK